MDSFAPTAPAIAYSNINGADIRAMSPTAPPSVVFCRISMSCRNKAAYNRSWSLTFSPAFSFLKVSAIGLYWDSGTASPIASPTNGISSALGALSKRLKKPCGPFFMTSVRRTNASNPSRASMSAAYTPRPSRLYIFNGARSGAVVALGSCGTSKRLLSLICWATGTLLGAAGTPGAAPPRLIKSISSESVARKAINLSNFKD